MTAQKAQLTSASTISWSGGQPFNGFVLLIASLPETDSAYWTQMALRDTQPPLKVPLRYKVNIREGVYDPSTYVWRTDGLVPPGVRYSAFFYDSTGRFVAPGDDLFAVTATPYTLAPPTLTDPTPSVVTPDPEDVPGTGTTVVIFGGPTRESVTGTKNGTNTAFSISTTGSPVFVLWNGVVLVSPTDYTLSGTTLTMVLAPDSGDSLEAIIYGG